MSIFSSYWYITRTLLRRKINANVRCLIFNDNVHVTEIREVTETDQKYQWQSKSNKCNQCNKLINKQSFKDVTYITSK